MGRVEEKLRQVHWRLSEFSNGYLTTLATLFQRQTIFKIQRKRMTVTAVMGNVKTDISSTTFHIFFQYYTLRYQGYRADDL